MSPASRSHDPEAFLLVPGFAPSRARTVFLFVLVCFVYGTTWLLIRVGLSDFPPFGYAGLRYLIACPILYAIARARGLSWPRGARAWSIPLLLGVIMFTVPFALIYHAEQSVPSGLAAVLFASHAIFVALLAGRFLPDEPLTAARILGAVIGIAGVLVVFLDRLEGPATLAGKAGIVLCAGFQAVSSIVVRRTQKGLSAIVLSCIGTGVGAVLLLASSALFEGAPVRHVTWQGALALAYLAVFGSVIAFTAAIHLIHTVGSNRVAMMVYVTPVLALTFGALLLGEPLHPRLLAGAALVIGGVWLTSRSARPLPATGTEP